MIKKFAWLFAVVFLLLGILGLVPGLIQEGYLFGIFQVDTMHNIVHILTGCIFGAAALMGSRAASMWFKLFALVYLAVAVWGFFTAEGSAVLGIINTNRADDWLHIVLAIVIGAIAFGVKPQEESSMGEDPQGGQM